MGDEELNVGKHHCSKESLRTSVMINPSLKVPWSKEIPHPKSKQANWKLTPATQQLCDLEQFM